MMQTCLMQEMTLLLLDTRVVLRTTYIFELTSYDCIHIIKKLLNARKYKSISNFHQTYKVTGISLSFSTHSLSHTYARTKSSCTKEYSYTSNTHHIQEIVDSPSLPPLPPLSLSVTSHTHTPHTEA